MGLGKLLKVSALVAGLGLITACSTVRFQPMDLGEVVSIAGNYEGNHTFLAVKGVPSLVTDKGFVLSDGDTTFHVKPGLISPKSIYDRALEQLRGEATDGDTEKVTVYGNIDPNIENNYLFWLRSIEIEGNLYTPSY